MKRASMDTMVTVIIPVYNAQRYIDECLRSVLAQTHSNLDVVVVDDGSTDRSAGICRRYAEADPRVRVLSKANGGQSSARNLGLDQARGSYVMFVDADDLIMPWCVESLLADVADTGCDVATAAFLMSADVPTAPISRAEGRREVMSGVEACERMLYQNSDATGLTPAPWCKLFAVRLFEKWRFREGIIYEDLELMPKVIRDAARVCASDRVVYFYRVVEGSTLGSFNLRRFDALDVCGRLVEYFGNDQRLSVAAADRLLSASFNMLMVMGRYGVSDEERISQCEANIRRLRGRSLWNKRVRARNRVGILISYVVGIRAFRSRLFARFLKR